MVPSFLGKGTGGFPPVPWSFRKKLEQASDLAGDVHVDALSSGDLGQTGHGHDFTSQSNQEAGTGGNLDVTDGDVEATGSAQLGLVVSEGVLSLSHADGHLVVTQLGQGLDLLLNVGSEGHAVSMIDALCDGFDLLLDGAVQLVG